MYTRSIKYLKSKSLLLLGPRGTGKSTWVRSQFPEALYLNLFDETLFQEFLRDPSRFRAMVEASASKTVIVDEIQRLPPLLNEIHRLIDEKERIFVLTGSSARKLRREGVNLLAGRARSLKMHPLTAGELSADFDIRKSIRVGHLPEAYTSPDPIYYLKSYVGTYLREEVQQEALVRNLGRFASFLEIAAFSQASVVTVNTVARDCGIDRKTAENYFQLLEDLLIAFRIPVFQKRAKRKLASHSKFFYFDVGVYRSLRKKGPLDPSEEIEGAAIETLVAQELRAINDNAQLGYEMYFWRTHLKQEVDFVLYGERGFHAIEVKRSSLFRKADLASLELFLQDYKEATGTFLYLGEKTYQFDRIRVVPLSEALPTLGEIIG